MIKKKLKMKKIWKN